MEKVIVVEKTLVGMIKEMELSPRDVLIGVMNSFYHGEHFPGCDWGNDDEKLGKVHEGLEIAVKAVQED